VISTIVTIHRTIFQITVKAVPVKPMWPSMPEPIDAPNRMSAAAMPPRTSVVCDGSRPRQCRTESPW
jgi:hypothetical protein